MKKKMYKRIVAGILSTIIAMPTFSVPVNASELTCKITSFKEDTNSDMTFNINTSLESLEYALPQLLIVGRELVPDENYIEQEEINENNQDNTENVDVMNDVDKIEDDKISDSVDNVEGNTNETNSNNVEILENEEINKNDEASDETSDTNDETDETKNEIDETNENEESVLLSMIDYVLPKPLVVHAEEEYMTIQVTWREINGKALDTSIPDTFIYEPILPEKDKEGHKVVLAEGVELPQYTIHIIDPNPPKEKTKPAYRFDGNIITMFYDGNNYQSRLLFKPDDITVNYSSSNTDVAEIDSNGKITPHSAGSATITACSNEDDNYLGYSTTCMVNVITGDDAYTVEDNGEWRNTRFKIKANSGYYLKEKNDAEHVPTNEIYVEPVLNGRSGTGMYGFYVVDENTGAVSGKRYVPYKMDRKGPEAEIHCIGMVFNKYYTDSENESANGIHVFAPNTATITARDNDSGLKSVQYIVMSGTYSLLGLEDAIQMQGRHWTEYHDGDVITLQKDWNVIYVKVIDNVGNVNYISTKLILNCTLSHGEKNPNYPYDNNVNTNTDKNNSSNSSNSNNLNNTNTLNVSVSNIKAQNYTGKSVCPKLTVKDGKTNKKLKQGKNYILSYENNVNAGTATVVIKGINGYDGEKRVNFTINPQNISKKVKTKVIGKRFTYTGNEITPNVSISYNKRNLNSNDYDISYADNVAKGSGKIYLTGKGNFTGTKVIKFKITGPKISDASISLSTSSATYGDINNYPKVIVNYGGRTCVEGVDYKVVYPKWKAGNNSICIQGLGNLSGSTKRTFVINKCPIDNVAINVNKEYSFNGKKISPMPTLTLNGVNLNNKKDYMVKYKSISTGKLSSNISSTGEYQMIITGKGCVQGTKGFNILVK